MAKMWQLPPGGQLQCRLLTMLQEDMLRTWRILKESMYVNVMIKYWQCWKIQILGMLHFLNQMFQLWKIWEVKKSKLQNN